MKRNLILFLVLILLIPCLVVPASASSWTDSDVEDAIGGIQMVESAIYEWSLQWYAYFFEATETVNDVSGADALVTPFKYDLIEAQMFVWSWIGTVFDDIKTDVSRLESYVYQIYQYTLSLPTRLSEWFASTFDWLGRIKDSIGNIFYSVETFRSDFSSFVNSFLRGDSSSAESFLDDQVPLETEVDEMVDIMSTSPTVDEEFLYQYLGDLSDITAMDDTGIFSMFMTALFSFQPIFMLCAFSFILAIVGFLLYGKR